MWRHMYAMSGMSLTHLGIDDKLDACLSCMDGGSRSRLATVGVLFH